MLVSLRSLEVHIATGGTSEDPSLNKSHVNNTSASPTIMQKIIFV